MGFLLSLVCMALCVVVYVRMVNREVPEKLTIKKAVIPCVFGFFSIVISTAFVMGLGLLAGKLVGKPISDLSSNLVGKSLIKSFLTAGFSEELAKLLAALLALRIVKPKNVYEYVLTFVGVAVGFTLLEENLYSEGGLAMFGRVPTFALHMIFQLIMGYYLGRARYEKEQGNQNTGKLVFLGLFLPVLWHTLFDAVTAFNAGMASENDNVALLSAVIAIIVIIGSTVLQFVLLAKFKKNTERLCKMELKPQ